MNFFEISRPSPVPSILLFFSLSSLSYALKSFLRSSSLMPIPVSLTENLILHVSLVFSTPTALRVNPPISVYFAALLSRFRSICLILPESPYMRFGSDSSISRSKARSFSLAFSLIMVTTEPRSSWVSYSCSARLILPDSILDISSRSSIRLSRDDDACLISRA